MFEHCVLTTDGQGNEEKYTVMGSEFYIVLRLQSLRWVGHISRLGKQDAIKQLVRLVN